MSDQCYCAATHAPCGFCENQRECIDCNKLFQEYILEIDGRCDDCFILSQQKIQAPKQEPVKITIELLRRIGAA